MHFRSPTIFFFLSLIATEIGAQPLVEVGHYGENIGTVAVDGSKGVINEGTRIRAIDLAIPSSPSLRGSVDVGTVPTGVFVVGDYAYVAGNTGPFSIVNITNLDAPTVSGSIDWEAWKNAVWVRRSADYAYLGICSTVEVIDVRNKTAPSRVRTLGQMEYCVESITGDGGYLYVVTDTATTRVRIYSLVDPANPVLIGSVPGNSVPSRRNNSVAVFGDVLYVGQEDGTQAYDIADRTTPRLIGRVEGENRYYETAMDVDRGLLYVADWERMNVWQLASPDAPSAFREIWGGPAHQVRQVAAFSGFGLAARTHTLTMANPSTGSSADIRSATPGIGHGHGLAAKGTALYMGTGPGLATFSIASPTMPALLKHQSARWPVRLEVVDDSLYNLSSWGYLELYNIASPANPTFVAEYPISGGFDTLRISGTSTIVAATAGDQFVLYSREGSGLLTERSRTTMPAASCSVALSGSTAFVALANGTLRAYNITNLAAPSLTATRTVFATIGAPGIHVDSEISGNRLHLLYGRTGYALVDITAPSNPTVLGTYQSFEFEVGDIAIGVDGSVVYLATFGWQGRRGLRALNITNPTTIQNMAATTASGLTRSVLIFGGYLFAAEDRGALRVRNLVPGTGTTFDGLILN